MARRILSLLLLAILAGTVAVGTASAAARHHRGAQTHRICPRAVTTHTRRESRRATTRRAAARCATASRRRALARAAALRLARKPTARPAASSPAATSTPAATSSPATASAGLPSSVSGGLVVGINANVSGWGDASTQPRLAQVVSQTHTKWLREDFRWDTIEPSPGQFDFSYYDHFMLLAAQAGEHILPVLYHAPAWAGASYSAIPSDPSAYAQFVAAVIGRYGTNGSFWNQYPSLRSSAIQTWEIWNEPYYSTGDNGNYNPGNYARLVKAAAIAGRAADPTAKFLLASEMQSAQDANGNWQWWTDALYQAVPDLNNYFDAVAVHPYGSDTTTLHTQTFGQPYNNYNSMLRIQDIRQQFVNHGAASKPFWITEIGWSTCSSDPQCVTPAQQATNLANLFTELHGNWSSWVQAAFLYHYTDGDNPSSNIEDGFGLTTNTSTPKPALAIFQSQAALSAS